MSSALFQFKEQGENDLNYRKVFGCPIHGTKKGSGIIISNKASKEEIPGFRCDKCKKIYIEPINDDNSYKGKKIREYEICCVTGPRLAKETMYKYDKKNKSGLCKCNGSFKEKMKPLDSVLLKDGTVTRKFCGLKVCRQCNRIFLSNSMYSTHKKQFDLYGGKVDQLDHKEASVNVIETKEVETVNAFVENTIDTKAFNGDWQNEVFSNDDYNVNDTDFSELTPANRVASAYYDANITFNPYQYLPWLKMYINGAEDILISDEVGLGKTIEAGILILEEFTQNTNSRIIVICPAFIREKWYQELNEKFSIDSQIYDGKNHIDSMTKLVILPISRIRQYLENEQYYDFSMVVVDEVHYFKNSSSKRYEYLDKLLEIIGNAKKVFMSATPVNNSGNDYYSIARLFGSMPDRTNTTKKQAYITLPERKIKDVYIELSDEEKKVYHATDSLHPFSGTIYRHIGASCLYALSRYAYAGGDLPSETKEELRDSLELLMEGRLSIDEENEFLIEIKNLTLPEKDSKLTKLKEVLASFDRGNRIVLFSHYIETVKYLCSELTGEFDTGYIYANTVSNNIPCKNKNNRFVDAKKWFSNPTEKTRILICSDSCREGIDLDMANVLVNYDLPFNPSILEQRIGRIDRMSQKKDMFIYNFHVNETYDDRLHFILSAKLRFINFYANYSIGNPLNITTDGNYTFESFIRFFKGSKFATMSNDDYYVTKRILNQIGIKLERKDAITADEVQRIIIRRLRDNQEIIEKWFENSDIKEATEEQLRAQYRELEKLLNFPKKIRRRIEIDEEVAQSIADKANENPEFRKRISNLIIGYSDKLNDMEITGMPMVISKEDLKKECSFGDPYRDDFIQNSVVEVLRNEGARVYDIK